MSRKTSNSPFYAVSRVCSQMDYKTGQLVHMLPESFVIATALEVLTYVEYQETKHASLLPSENAATIFLDKVRRLVFGKAKWEAV